MTASQADLDAAVAQLEGDVATAATEMNSAFARLQAKIDAGASAPDLTAEVGKLTDLHAALLAAVASAQGEAPTPLAA